MKKSIKKIIAQFDSSNLDTAIYDTSSKLLTVTFHRGGTYNYYGVPGSQFQALIRAKSAGQYLNNCIKGKYQYSQVEQ